MAPPEENVQNQPVPQIPLQRVVFNDLAGMKAPEFGTQMIFQGHSRNSRDIASSCFQLLHTQAGHQRREQTTSCCG